MRTPHRLVAVVAVPLLAVVAACGSPQSAPPGQGGGGATGGAGGNADTKVTIGIGGQTLLTYLPTTLAQELGYYKEAGLDVSLQDLQGGSKALTAMIGGSTDVTSGYYEHTIQMQAKNQQVKAFANLNQSPGVVLVVAPKNKDAVSKVGDLQGKNIGVTAPGSSTDMFVKYLLNKNGLPLDAASVSGIGAGSSAVAAVEKGQVDAAVMLEPDITVLAKRIGSAPKVLADTRTHQQVQALYGTQTWPSSSFYAKSDWLQQNPEKAKKLANAMTKTLTWIQQHSGEEIAAKMPANFNGGDAAQYAKVVGELKETLSKDGKFTDAGAQAVLKTQQLANPEVKGKTIDLATTYTNEFVGG